MAANASAGLYTLDLGSMINPPSTSVTITTAKKRSGTGCYKFDSGGTNVLSRVQGVIRSVTLTATVFYRAYLAFDSLVSASASTQVMFIGNIGGTQMCCVRLNNVGTASLTYGLAGSQTVVGSTAVGAIPRDGSWHRFELALTIGTGAVDGVTLLIDGVQIATVSSVAISELVPNLFGVGWNDPLSGGPGANSVMYADDIAINDGTGTAQNTYPGEGKILMLKPTADVSRVGWTDGAGGTTALFDALDNWPPVGVAVASSTATSQIKDLANNTTDAYTATMQTYAIAGVPSGASIQVVQVYVEGSNDGAAATVFTVTCVSNPAGAGSAPTQTQAATAGIWPSNWHGYLGGTLYNPAVDPAVAPTVSVTKGTASATVTQTVDLLGLVVEYVEQTPPVKFNPVPFIPQGKAA